MSERKKGESVTICFDAGKKVELGFQRCFNTGYLFLQSIYYSLGIQKICEEIDIKYDSSFNSGEILSRIIYSSIIFPPSADDLMACSEEYFEQPSFNLEMVRECINVLDKESRYISSKIPGIERKRGFSFNSLAYDIVKLIINILMDKTENKYRKKALFNALYGTRVVLLKDSVYSTMFSNTEISVDLCNIFNLKLNYNYVMYNDLMDIVDISKGKSAY